NRRLAAFAAGADPVVDALRPAARALSPTLRDVRATAPELAAFVRALGPAIDASRDGAPELARFLRAARPLLAELPGFLRELDPILSLVGEMKRELAGGVLANWVAATQIADGHGHYLRTELVLNPEGLAPYERRIGTNRAQPYARGGDDRLAVFDARSCANPSPRLARVDTELLRRIAATVIGPAAPPCLAARPPGGQAYAHAVRRAGP
ncbi:MAG: MCE family protein, partial [Solirubrobacterales bacterium]|nr:MCE family protein [Solirubrobacterales bacterium]